MDRRTPEAARGRVRLSDVAELAGVTKSVASRVLNDDPTLSARAETRRRVVDAAQQLGYRPHAGAVALAQSRAKALALLIPDLTNPVYSRVIRGAYRRARQLGYVVLLAEDTPETEADEAFTDLVGAGRVDGLLIASARPGHRLLETAGLAGVPHVFVNRAVPGSGRNITVDVGAASATAARHLAALGHRRVGHVAGPVETSSGRDREEAFIATARELGLPEPAVVRAEFSEAGGAEATRRLLDESAELTALYASTLPQAVGVLHALRAGGRRVPADVSVITYDDLPFAEYQDPPLTTIAMPLQELGATAVDALLAQLGGEEPSDVVVPGEPEVVERGSTAPPR
ncbi:LacI family DNA-binding transcriptional regulator [Saccharopolyspora griseoalba]|uniref:LacI family DNA-binding transcriptional regulator n=1 Tax=Saccharopolyspora griseoalba TaxID=1431848 RepID=A0ABW2LNZ6_9PSEU